LTTWEEHEQLRARLEKDYPAFGLADRFGDPTHRNQFLSVVVASLNGEEISSWTFSHKDEPSAPLTVTYNMVILTDTRWLFIGWPPDAQYPTIASYNRASIKVVTVHCVQIDLKDVPEAFTWFEVSLDNYEHEFSEYPPTHRFGDVSVLLRAALSDQSAVSVPRARDPLSAVRGESASMARSGPRFLP